MHFKRSTLFLSLAAAAGCTNAVDTNGSLEPVTTSITAELSASSSSLALQNVPANPKATGFSSPNILSPQLIESSVAQGSFALENPQTVTLSDGTTATAAFYGYDDDGPMMPAAGDLPSATHNVEATKTEPDKNTYLVLFGQTGADPTYDYGTHFLFQGHETWSRPGYITPHQPGRRRRPPRDDHGVDRRRPARRLADIDGSTWDPFAQRLHLHERERGAPEYQATLSFPSVVEDISGAIGRGGYEGVQNDSDGNLWIVEDVGGATSAATPNAKVPNSFIYRFVPKHKDDLTHGKLQVLQVTSLATGQPIVFHGTDVDIAVADVRDSAHLRQGLRRPRGSRIHDTDVDGTTPFDANALAKSQGRHAVQAPRERAVPSGRGLQGVLLRRDR